MNKQRLHLKAPDNWINDPNGFLYYKGSYHLFFQYFPYAPRWGTMHWGHAVSQDLVNWEHKGIALFPSKRADQNGCFSGSAVAFNEKMYLVYTGVRYEQVDPEDIHLSINEQFESTQMMISSEDGFQFDNWNDKSIIIPPITDSQIGDRIHTRDPKIWRGETAWYIILGSTLEKKQGEVLFYRSDDLQTWHYVNQANQGTKFGWMWECPDYFETKGGKVLLFSAMGIPQNGEREQNHTLCFKVEFEEEHCEMKIPDTYQFLDYGLDLYAPQTTLDEAGRRVMVAWVRMPAVTAAGWRGLFSSPRVVEVDHGHIYFRIHPNIRKAFSKELSSTSLTLPKTYKANFQLTDGDEISIGGFLIGRRGERVYTDRSAVFPDDDGLHLVSETPEIQDGWQIEALIDENLIEIFINDGEYVISNVVYNLKPTITSNVQKEIRLYTMEEN